MLTVNLNQTGIMKRILEKMKDQVANGNLVATLWKVIAGMGTVMMFMLGMFVQDVRAQSQLEQAEGRWQKSLETTQQMFIELHKDTQQAVRVHVNEGAHDVADSRLKRLEDDVKDLQNK